MVSHLVHYDTSLQNVTFISLQSVAKVYDKMRQVSYHKMHQFYYQMRQLLQNTSIYKMRRLLQNGSVHMLMIDKLLYFNHLNSVKKITFSANVNHVSELLI